MATPTVSAFTVGFRGGANTREVHAETPMGSSCTPARNGTVEMTGEAELEFREGYVQVRWLRFSSRVDAG